jgi:hypothetical protein
MNLFSIPPDKILDSSKCLCCFSSSDSTIAFCSSSVFGSVFFTLIRVPAILEMNPTNSEIKEF